MFSKYNAIILFFIFCFPILSKGQKIRKRVVETFSQNPIKYASIGVLETNIGTISDDFGEFELSIPEGVDTDVMVQFSSIGYESKRMSLRDLMKKNENINLNKVVIDIPEITVSANTFRKNKKFGNTTDSKKIVFYFQSNKLGTELACLIRLKRKKVFIKTINFNIAKNEYKRLIFRVNLYENRNGLPGRQINKEEILIETDIKSGMVTQDISHKNLLVEDDFFMGLEWVETFGEELNSDKLMFSASLGKRYISIRKSSQGKWKKFNDKKFGLSANLGFFIEGLY